MIFILDMVDRLIGLGIADLFGGLVDVAVPFSFEVLVLVLEFVVS